MKDYCVEVFFKRNIISSYNSRKFICYKIRKEPKHYVLYGEQIIYIPKRNVLFIACGEKVDIIE